MNNYFISKDVNNNRTNTNVKLLHEKEVIEEIARISAGEINEVAIIGFIKVLKLCFSKKSSAKDDKVTTLSNGFFKDFFNSLAFWLEYVTIKLCFKFIQHVP